jgi:CHRD domain-containing protein
MVTTRRLAAPLMALSLLVPSLGRAHIAEFTANLNTGQEIPPVLANSGTGTGMFVLEDDGTVEAMVSFQGLTGPPTAAHIHQGAAGVANPVPLVDFTSSIVSASTITGTGTKALTEAEQQTLFAGGMYFNIHTVANRGGEIRGQIHLKPGVCSCDTATSPGAFKRCVKKALRTVEKAERKEESVKTLRKLLAKSACGKTKPAAKKQVACCLPVTPAQNIVTDRMCATLKATQCENLRGTSLGTGVACAPPNPCTVGSPSGAFIEAPAAD